MRSNRIFLSRRSTLILLHKQINNMAKKKPSYDFLADILGAPATNHQKKKAVAKVLKPVVKPITDEFKSIAKDLQSILKF
jgi:preprotein translocase subunit Sss1